MDAGKVRGTAVFFIGIFGIGSKEYPAGFSDRHSCVICGRPGTVKRFAERKYFHIFFIPLFYWGEKLCERCTACGAVYGFESPEERQRGGGTGGQFH